MVLESQHIKENKPQEIIRINIKDINERTKFHDIHDAILLWFCNSHYTFIESLHNSNPKNIRQDLIISSFKYDTSFYSLFKENFKHIAPITPSPISCGEELIGVFRNIGNYLALVLPNYEFNISNKNQNDIVCAKLLLSYLMLTAFKNWVNPYGTGIHFLTIPTDQKFYEFYHKYITPLGIEKVVMRYPNTNTSNILDVCIVSSYDIVNKVFTTDLSDKLIKFFNSKDMLYTNKVFSNLHDVKNTFPKYAGAANHDSLKLKKASAFFF